MAETRSQNALTPGKQAAEELAEKQQAAMTPPHPPLPAKPLPDVRKTPGTEAKEFTYHPGFGDPEEIVFYGFTMPAGKPVKINDAAAIAKAEKNLSFMPVEDREALVEAHRRVSDPAYAEMRERAERQAAELADAKRDPDRDAVKNQRR